MTHDGAVLIQTAATFTPESANPDGQYDLAGFHPSSTRRMGDKLSE